MFGKNKVNKIKSAWPQRIGRIVLWILVIFLMLRGIGSVLKADSATATQEVISQFEQNKDYKNRVEKEAAAYAEMFALEYMTYSGNNEDYNTRIRKFTDFDLTGGTYNDKTEAITSESYLVSWIDTNKVSVDCRIKVRYTIKAQKQVQAIADGVSSETTPTIAQTSSITIADTYLRIPVTELNGKYIVEDYPVFITALEKSEQPKKESSTGDEVTGDIKKQIQAVVSSFLKAYCTGNDVEISYYMANSNTQVKGLNKRYVLKDLKQEAFTVNKIGSSDKYFVTVEFNVIDSINNQVFKQGMELSVINQNGKYLIEKFDAKLKSEDLKENKK